MIADWDSLGEEPIGYSHDVTVRADSNSRTHSTTGGVLGHLNGDINYAESTVEVPRMDSRDRADDRSGVDGVERAADASCEDEVAEDPLDGKGECDPVCDDSHIQHIGGNNEKHSSNVEELSNIGSTQCVSGVKDRGDSADELASSTGEGEGVQGLIIQGTHNLTGEIHGEASCGGESAFSLIILSTMISSTLSNILFFSSLKHRATVDQ